MLIYKCKPLSRSVVAALKGGLVGALLVNCLAANAADKLDKVFDARQAAIEAGQKSQVKIDGIADQTNDLLQDFKQVSKEIEGLRVYNAQLEARIQNQLERIAQIDESIINVKSIQRQIPPLLVKMLDGLENFVALDVPFHLEEREVRTERLRDNMGKSNQSVAENFRQVLEAYKIENEYGRKLDAYKGSVDIDGVERDVNFFRVGRVALLYQTTDTEISGAWDQSAREWVSLDRGEYRNAIMKGLRIARKEASIDLMNLPVPTPEAE